MTEHNPNGNASPVTAHQSPETREIYRLIMDVRIKMRGVTSYLNAEEYGVFAPHPLSSELHETAEAIKTICALCLQTKNADALRDLTEYGDVWQRLIEYDEARGVNFYETIEVITAMGEAWRIKNELRVAAFIEADKRKRRAANTPRKFTPLFDNAFMLHPSPVDAANAVFGELIDSGFINRSEYEAQAETWRYFWNVGEYPQDLRPINWTRRPSLLAYLISELNRGTKNNIWKNTAAAFTINGTATTSDNLRTEKSRILNKPTGVESMYIDILINLKNRVLGASK